MSCVNLWEASFFRFYIFRISVKQSFSHYTYKDIMKLRHSGGVKAGISFEVYTLL